MKHSAVLLDTSFFLRFLNDDDILFRNADEYFRYFLQKNIQMVVSTISIAEYCVGGALSELPLKNLRILPFNFDHSKRTGVFAGIIFRNKNRLKLTERNIIPNDTKLFAQADVDITIEYYLSSDKESLKIYTLLKQETDIGFRFLDLNTPCHQTFGFLPF